MIGPVDTTTDNAIFDPGDITEDFWFDANVVPFGIGGPMGRGPGEDGLAAAGTAGGSPFAQNTLVALVREDGLDIGDPTPGRKCSFEFGLAAESAVRVTVFGADPDVPVGSFTFAATTTATRVAVVYADGIERVNLTCVDGEGEPTAAREGVEWIRPHLQVATGDLNHDWMVGFIDLLTLLAASGPCPGEPADFCLGDLDCDGSVGFSDLLALLSNWSP